MIKNSKIVLMLCLLFTINFAHTADKIPEFSKIKNVKEKKKAFFNFMFPLIVQSNKNIINERMSLKNKNLSEIFNTTFWNKLTAKYNVSTKNKTPEQIKKLLLTHINIIPPSLALAQSANESSWGTSRFARLGRNFYGQWCFSKGCGIVPLRRNKGGKHEVRKFKSALDSVQSYMLNLNKGNAYKKLRKIRSKIQSKNKFPDGIKLSEGLINYSERKQEYIKELQSMIKYNKLYDYDKKLMNLIKKP